MKRTIHDAESALWHIFSVMLEGMERDGLTHVGGRLENLSRADWIPEAQRFFFNVATAKVLYEIQEVHNV